MSKKFDEKRFVELADGQKFIGESRAPRVQIEYDVELYGGQKKVELPFVVGVMADLSGDNVEVLGSVEDREFEEINNESFDKMMSEINPKLKLLVENKLNDDGTLIDVNLDFKSMEDFEPAEIAKKIPELSKLLEVRAQLQELVTYMDGKTAAEDIIRELLKKNNIEDIGAQIENESVQPIETNPSEKSKFDDTKE